MNNMAESLANQLPISGDSNEERRIAEVIHAETQAFMEADFDAWSRYFVHDDRTIEFFVTAATGLAVNRGWTSIAARTRRAMENGLGCGMESFRQGNLRTTIEGETAWVVFDGWARNRGGATWEKFESRILEHGADGWKIVLTATVEKRSEDIAPDALSVDRDGRLLWASPETLEKVKRHPVLTLSAGRVRARRRDWDKALQKAVAEAGRFHDFFELRTFASETGGQFRYPAVLGETDEGGVAVVHVSVRDCVTYIQFDGDVSLDRRLAVAKAVFGLSDGQSRIARHIANGVGVKSAAEALGISVNTARTHLARLYEKTGVGSQTALVRLLLSVG
jgi:DNA-binding CsgD family transcriptional regulator